MAVRDDQLAAWRNALQSPIPILGGVLRRQAIRALVAQRNEPEAVPLLVEAWASADQAVTAQAEAALGDLTAQAAIDALGALWADGRDPRLGQMLTQRGYVASRPLAVMAVTALKCGRRVEIDRAAMVPLLLDLTRDRDETVRTGALASLEDIGPGLGAEALCDEAVKNPAGLAAELCMRKGLRPSDHDRRCLFLFVTGQLDDYFQEDFEFQALRSQYDRAQASVKARVMEIIRSGDRRCAGFFAVKTKPLAECTEAEIKLAVQGWLRHEDWEHLFAACLELPAKYSQPILARLKESAWEPDGSELKDVLRRSLAGMEDGPREAEEKVTGAKPLLDRWLALGSGGELATLDETALCERLREAAPTEGVAIVGALASKKRLSDNSRTLVRTSPHWLVRLAGYAAGLYSGSLTEDSLEDSNSWVNELAWATTILNTAPGRVPPVAIGRVLAARRETWTGQLSSIRNVARTIMPYRVTTGSFEPVVVEIPEDTGEFVVAKEAELERGPGAAMTRGSRG